ncbi:MAG TPA: sensor histidine kinase [Gemmataceae bacterium]|nr:sensor histidine kinase [Gemmataceae bacterium]
MAPKPKTNEVDDSGARKSSPAWHRLYYLLVAFDVFTVSMSLYLNQQIMEIYVRSVEVNQAWVERLHETSKLGQLAADVNAPGNDVFQSRQLEAEWKSMHEALAVFTNRLETVRQELQDNVEPHQAGPLLAGLQTAQQTMQAMTTESDRLFEYLKNKRPTEAGESMATMDRHFAKVNRALEQLRRDIAAIQQEHFEKQTGAAAALQRFQYGIAALILLMIAGAAVYGHIIRKQVEADGREKEAYIAALRHSEACLDLRVRERTAELVQANESSSLMRRQLLQQVMSAQEDERRRIARDLHDEIGQALTSVLIGLRTVADAATMEMAREQTENLRRITLATLKEVHRLARGLRPSVLDDLGLAPALERYAADFTEAHGIAVTVQAPDPTVGRLPEEVETALYRIVQEALSNVAKHADAHQANILIEHHRGSVEATIEDDGRGFDCKKIDKSGRLGLSGMRERAALLDGSVTISSTPGTKITVRIPLRQEQNVQDSRVAC